MTQPANIQPPEPPDDAIVPPPEWDADWNEATQQWREAIQPARTFVSVWRDAEQLYHATIDLPGDSKGVAIEPTLEAAVGRLVCNWLYAFPSIEIEKVPTQ